MTNVIILKLIKIRQSNHGITHIDNYDWNGATISFID